MYRLIVVDDESSVRHGLGLIDWGALGFELTASFADGDAALEYLEGNPVDVAITDIVMPRVSGLELAKWVYKNRPDTFVVLLSGYSDFKNAQAAIAFRVVRYLLKPTDPDELYALFHELKALLDERGAREGRSDMAREQYGAQEGQAAPWAQTNAQETQPAPLPQPASDPAADAPSPAASGDFDLLESVNRYLETHLSESASLSELAKYLYLSPSYLSHLFRAQADTTYSKYATQFKLETSRRMLEESTAKVCDISLAVGYRDVRYFLHLFREAYGVSPTAYRRRLASKPEDRPRSGARRYTPPR